MRALLCFLILMVSSFAQAAIIRCPKQAQTDPCGQCESQLVADTRAFLEEIKSGRSVFRHGDDFLQALKVRIPVLFNNYVIMEHSESAQRSKPGSPRILLKSPDSEVLMGFGTSHFAAGYERIEFILWSGEKGEWEFVELMFPEDIPIAERGGYLSQNGYDRRPVVTSNPALCLSCHAKFGGDPKPNWDAYYLWAGQLPMRQDVLVEGTDEERRYVEFYRIRQPRDPRLSLLRVPGDVADYLSRSAYGEEVQWIDNTGPGHGPRHGRGVVGVLHRIEHQGGQKFTSDNSGPGTILFNQLEARNLCRISKKIQNAQVRDEPLYPKIRYAVAGAIEPFGSTFEGDEKRQGCPNFKEFFPPWYAGRANRYFSALPQTVGPDQSPVPSISGSDFKSLYSSIRSSTQARQVFHFTEKTGRVRKHWKENTGLGASNGVDREWNRFEDVLGIKDREMSLGYISKLRMVLEPWGVEMRNFSLSNLADTMTFGDFFLNDQIRDLELTRSVHAEYDATRGRNEKFCDWASKRSSRAMGEEPAFEPVAPAVPAPIPSSVPRLTSVTPDPATAAVLPNSGSESRVPDSCVLCHVDAPSGNLDRTGVPFSIPGPRIPFQDRTALSRIVQQPGGRAFVDKIMNRVARGENEGGRMPFPPAPPLSERERESLRNFLESLGPVGS